jgi:large subunit ribosomal protein L4e
MKRHAVACALAASTLPPLVMARGHKIDEVAELPLVVTDEVEKMTKTKDAVKLLAGLGCQDDLDHVSASRKARGGVAKLRNRKYTMRRGPLVVYNKDDGIVRAFRNIPGVDVACVDRLNLLKLAPGGTFGRFVIFTEGAFKKLNEIYGTYKSGAPGKKGYHLPRAQMENADIARIINSDEVQKVVKPKLDAPKTFGKKKNPLKNKALMEKLNPGATEAREKRAAEQAKPAKKAKKAKSLKTASKKYYADLMGAFEAAKAKADAEKAAAKKAADGDDDEDEE